MKENVYDRNGLPKLSKSKNEKWLDTCEKAGEIVGTIVRAIVLGIIKYSKILINKLREEK